MTDAREPLRNLNELLAAVCDQTASLEDLRRIESLAGDAKGIDYVVDYLQLDGLLRWECGLGTGEEGSPAGVQSSEDAADSRRGTAEAVEGSAAGAQGLAFADQQPEMIPDPQVTPAPAPLIPPIVIHASDAVPTVFSFSMSHLGGWLISYGAATVIVGMAILGSWVYRVSHDYRIAGPSSRSPAADVAVREKEPGLVGQITGMTDCRWATPPVTPVDAGVSLGCKYVLTSGLMEITYQTGAKVILQGPVAYEVDSSSGGFLSLGKLTARVENSEIRNPKSEILNSKSPSLQISKFVVRTPSAVVTDLGTEFGVEVDKFGATWRMSSAAGSSCRWPTPASRLSAQFPWEKTIRPASRPAWRRW